MTDKKDEALKLALEALKKCDAALAEELAAWDIDPPLHHVQEASNACGPAITALREALAEQPAQQEPVAYIRNDQLQKAAQSPMLCEVTPEPRQDRIGIFTSPQPSKPWVGLTPAHLADCILKGRGNEVTTWKLIEAKLKELNT